MKNRTLASRRRRPIEALEGRLFLDATYHNLATSNFSQDWSATASLLTASNNWNSVPSIIGNRGDGLTNDNTADPQNTLAPSNPANVNLIPQSSAGSGTGGVHEIEAAPQTIALQGSGTADAPHILIHLDATGRENLLVSYTLKELDGSLADQKFALHYRVGETGNFTNVPAGAVSNYFNTAGNQTQAFTDIALPAAVNGQSQVQLRIMTNDAALPAGDAMVGVDDIVVKSSAAAAATLGIQAPTSVTVSETATDVSFTVSRSSGAGSASFNYTTNNGTATAGSDFTTTSGSHTFNPGETSTVITVPLTPSDTNVEPIENFTITLSDITGANAGFTTATVTITDNDKPAAGTGHLLSGGPLTQNWNNTAQITTDDDWSGVAYFFGYRGDDATAGSGVDPRTVLAPRTDVLDVNANKDTNYLFTTGESAAGTGGVAELEVDMVDPTITLNGSGTGDSPFVLFEVNTTGVDAVNVAYNVRDIELIDNAQQQVVLQYRVGNTGDFTNVLDSYIADATDLNDTLVTPVSVIVAGPAGNQPLVQFRVMTTNAFGNDEFIGIDDIVVQQTTNAPGALTFEPGIATVNEDAGTVTLKVVRTGGALGAVSVDYNVATGTADGSDFNSTASGTLNFANGDVEETFTIAITDDTTAEIAENFTVTLSNATGGAAVGLFPTKTVRIVDNDVYKLADGALEQDWTDTAALDQPGDWGGVIGIRGYLGDGLTGGTGTNPTTIEDFGSGTLSLQPNEFDPDDVTTGGVAEFELGNPTVALTGSGTADAPFLLFELDTTGVSSVDVSYTLRDIEGGTTDAAQQIALQYRIGNTGDFLNVPGSHITDATTIGLGPDILQSFTVAAAGNQPLVQFRILTTNAVSDDEWVGIDDIVIEETPDAGLPIWLDPLSIATWDDGTSTLTVNGAATIIADPAESGDFPLVTVAGEGVVLNIDPTEDLIVHLTELHVQNAARVNVVSLGGERTASNHRVLVIDSDGFSVDSASTLDLADNDMVIDYDVDSGQLGDVQSLISTGFNGGDWLGFGGIVSSAAELDPSVFGLGYADNVALGSPFGSTLSGPAFAGVDVDDTAVLIKYTYVGDLTLDGLISFEDLSIFNTAYDNGASSTHTWIEGDVNYDGLIDFQDLSLFNTNYDESKPQV